MKKSLHIFTHRDADGKFSGALMYEYFKKYRKDVETIHVHEIDYTVEIRDNMSVEDVVVFTDYSFTNSKNLNLLYKLVKRGNEVIWIDHHDSSIDIINSQEFFEELTPYNNFTKVIYKNKCAAYLTYVYLKSIITKGRFNNFISEIEDTDVPLVIKYVDSYDTWKHYIYDDIEFDYGMRCENINAKNAIKIALCHNSDLDIFKCNPKTEYAISKFIARTVSNGNKIKKYINLNNNEILKNNGFEFIINDYKNSKNIKGLAVNNYGNSLVFGKKYDEYDIVCVFNKVGNEMWKYGLYSNRDDIDCKYLAEVLGAIDGLGGGGHKSAAGFQTKKCIFDSGNIISISTKLFSKKEKVFIMNGERFNSFYIPYYKLNLL